MMPSEPVWEPPPPRDAVVDLGEARIRLRAGLKTGAACRHTSVTLDHEGGTILCDDCGASIDAMTMLVRWLSLLHWRESQLTSERHHVARKLKEVRAYRPHLRVAKYLERIWRGRRMAPCCPHCKCALLPEDFGEDRHRTVSAELERQRRKAEAKS